MAKKTRGRQNGKKRKLPHLTLINGIKKLKGGKKKSPSENIDSLINKLSQPGLSDDEKKLITDNIKYYQSVIEGNTLIKERENKYRKLQKKEYVHLVQGGSPGLKK